MSPISSRNSVPPCAYSNRPILLESAPVNAPFTCPNSSLSNSVSTTAEQLHTTIGPDAWLSLCSACATSSLPVPVGPVTAQAAVVRRHAANLPEHLPHQRTAPYHPLELAGVHQLAVQLADTLAPPRIAGQLADTLPQYGQRNGLGQVIASALLDGFHGGLGGVMRRHQDHVGGRIHLQNLAQQFHAVHLRHHHIAQHDFRALAAHQFQAALRVVGREDLEAVVRESFRDQFQALRIVVDGE